MLELGLQLFAVMVHDEFEEFSLFLHDGNDGHPFLPPYDSCRGRGVEVS
jgi:hypothetical protein